MDVESTKEDVKSTPSASVATLHPERKREGQQGKESKRQKISGNEKTIRRNLMDMWLDQTPEGLRNLDRLMIGLHRFQTEGKVAYRRLIGMHGGGGGTSDLNFFKLMQGKMDADITAHYNGVFPDQYWWPEPVPNAAAPKKIDSPDPFAYTFCWHGKTEFIVWHRALLTEFERMLQDYDPLTDDEYPAESSRHSGPGALGVAYWAWEHWDGLTLPIQLTTPTYVIRGDWPAHKLTAGTLISNPFHRWFAPVSLDQQRQEYFPPSLNVSNCTTRSASFDDPTIPHELPWPILSQGDKAPSMIEVVNRAIGNPDFAQFASTENGHQWSIENPHNKFHNHIGGFTLGGTQGPGKQSSLVPSGDDKEPQDYYTGTMTQNQSIFDPIFWLHHSNVERQLISWQRLWYPKGTKSPETNPPSETLMKSVLYPWTKPELVANGQYSWNTPVGDQSDATFGDWFNAELPYEYDALFKPSTPLRSAAAKRVSPLKALVVGGQAPVPARVLLQAHLKNRIRGGEFAAWEDGQLLASIGVLSAWNGGCARCSVRPLILTFDITHSSGVNLDKLKLTRNGHELEIDHWTVEEKPSVG